MKRILTILLSVCMCFSAFVFTGCQREYAIEIDETKTQLYVGTFDGAYGDAWLYAVKPRFEEKYKDVSFEDGKKGVEIIINKDKNYKGGTLINNITSSIMQYEVFFTESIDYIEWINRGYMLDISDVVNSSLQYDFVTGKTDTSVEDETIMEKFLHDDYTEFLTTSDDKIYAVPFYDAFFGISYDVDLFEDENFYFAAEGMGDKDGFVRDLSTPKSLGLNGKTGVIDGIDYSYDDGLPTTYEEFYKLCERIELQSCVPITWAGGVQEYISYFLQALTNDYEGVENMRTDYFFEGQNVPLVTGFNGNVPLVEEMDVTKAESYKLNNLRAGKYYALSFMEKIIDNRDWYNEINCFGTDVTHLDAQRNFLNGKYIINRDRVAMLIDGTWWYGEAGGHFDTMVKTYGQEASAKNRRFGIMPLPKATTDKVGEDYTVSISGSSYGFVKSNIASYKVNLAKAFMQFVHTNKSLCEFTKITSATRPYEYTFTDTEFEDLTYYGKNVYTLKNTVKTLITYSKDEDYLRNSAKVGYMWAHRVSNVDYQVPSRCLYDHPSYTAKEMFNGLSNYYTPQKWETLYGPFGG